MNVLAGTLAPDEGRIVVRDKDLGEQDLAGRYGRHGPPERHPLRVPGAVALPQSHRRRERAGDASLAARLWLAQALGGADHGDARHASFPRHGISANDIVGDLPITRRQMVEIARAFTVTDTPAHLVILDEPTSSLDATVAEQLLAFVRSFVAAGGSRDPDLAPAGRDPLHVRPRRGDARRPVVEERRRGVHPRRWSRPWAASWRARTKRARRRSRGANPRADPGSLRACRAADADRRARSRSRRDRRSRGPRRPRADRCCSPLRHGPGRAHAGLRHRSRRLRRRRPADDGIFPLWSIARNIAIGSLSRLSRPILFDPAPSAISEELARAHRHPHRRHATTHPVAVGRQSAEGAVRPGAGVRRADHPDGRSDARRRHRHQAGGLRAHRDEAAAGPHVRLVHHRDGRVEALRPRLRVPRGRIVADLARDEVTEERVLPPRSRRKLHDRRVLPAAAARPAAGLASLRCCSSRSSGCSRGR
jgi:ribose transport system ATP-binding protein